MWIAILIFLVIVVACLVFDIIETNTDFTYGIAEILGFLMLFYGLALPFICLIIDAMSKK